jgi:hypothetical protein
LVSAVILAGIAAGLTLTIVRVASRLSEQVKEPVGV